MLTTQRNKIYKLIKSLHKRADIMSICKISKATYQKTYKEYIELQKKNKLIRVKKVKRGDSFGNTSISNFTKEFANEMLSLVGVSGCYLLFSRESKLLYVGQSSTLGNRIKESMEVTPDAVGVKVIKSSMSDAFVLEMILINKAKPPYNRGGKGWGDFTFEVPKKYDPFYFDMIWNT